MDPQSIKYPRQVDLPFPMLLSVMNKGSLVTSLIICFSSHSLSYAQEVIEQEPRVAENNLKPLPFIEEKVTVTIGNKKGKAWIIDEKFATLHKAEPVDHAPFMVTLMPIDAEVGKVLYHTRPKVVDLVRFTLLTNESKVAESIRFTTLTVPTNIPMDVRLAKSAELMEKHMVPNFAKDHKELTVGQRYRTKIGPYNGAVLLGKLTLQDDSVLFLKFVAILRENNPNGFISVMILNPAVGKKEELQQRMVDGYAQQILHSFRFLKKKAPAAEKEEIEVEVEDK